MPTFNGIDLRKWFVVGEKVRPLAPPIQNRLIEVPGRDGSYSFGHKLGVREISIPVGIFAKTREEKLKKAREVIGFLVTKEPKPLWFRDEPNVFYKAKLSGETNLEEFMRTGQTTLLFICPDPYRYDAIEKTEFFVNDQLFITNDGTANTKPIFRAAIKQASTYFSIKNQHDKTIRIGAPATVEQTEMVREELVFQDNMNSTASWQTADRADNGYVAGNMAADSNGFYPESFGDPIEPHRWQGPSLKRAIGYSLQDFQADIKVENLNVDFEVGMIEIYLLDANNNTVAKIGIEDVWRGTEQMIAKSQLGGTNGKWVFQEFPSIGNETGWNNFNGLLRISRVGRQWEMYVARFSPSGIHLTRRYFSFNDVAGSYMVPITQIQVATRSFPLRVPTEMRVKEIKIFRINQPQPVQEIPLAVQPGDVIEINTETSNLLLNGESRVDLYELSTDFFEIEQGINSYELYPKGIADVEVRYRRKWL